MATPAPSKKLIDAKTRVETQKLEAEIIKLAAETREAIAKAEQAEIEAAEARRSDERRLTADAYHHVYAFTSRVDDTSVKSCMRQLAEWSRLEPGCKMEIVFTSPGGSVVDGMALFDYILTLRSAGHEITTTALGVAASMAGILLQAGERRVMGSEAWMLIHEAAFAAMGKTGEIEDTVEWVKKVQKRILRIFAARSHLSAAQIERRWRRKDWWIDADDALKLGLIDEVRGLS